MATTAARRVGLQRRLETVDLLAYGLVFRVSIAPMANFRTVFAASPGMVAGDLTNGNVCNALYAAPTGIDKEHLLGAAAYGRAHQRLSRVASTLWTVS